MNIAGLAAEEYKELFLTSYGCSGLKAISKPKQGKTQQANISTDQVDVLAATQLITLLSRVAAASPDHIRYVEQQAISPYDLNP